MMRVSKTMGVLLCAVLVLSAAPVVAQSTLDGYAAANGVPGGPTAGGTAGPVTTEGGILMIFTDQGMFQTAAPGLPKEDFEAAQIAAGGVAACPAPCTDTGGCTGCFNPGDLETGLSIDNGPVSDPIQGLVILGAAAFGNASKVIVANTFTDFFIMDFSVPVNAVGFDAVSYIPSPEAITIEVFTTSGSQGTFNANASNAGTFWGVISTDPAELITSVTVFAPAGSAAGQNGAEGVDNLCFGFVNMGESDLSVAKSGVINGDQVSFSISVTNNGPDDATNVVVMDTLDAAVTYVSDDCGGTIMGQDWTWDVGNLANGATAVCNLVGTVAAGTSTVVNTASASAAQDDPNTANNTTTITAFPNALAIPTLGTLGLVALILALGGLAMLLLMHRRRTA